MALRVKLTRLGSAPMQKLIRTLMLTFLTAASATLSAAPVGYSINSDSPSEDSDGLYRIDLETGQTIERIGTVQTTSFQKFLDVEGLAFDANGRLWGIDDEKLQLFPIDLDNSAQVGSADTIAITGLTAQNNDFGMTFACDDNLYITSIKESYLYKVNESGVATPIGPLGANISALASKGEPVELYGLSNGTEGEGASGPPKLYRIDIETGAATEISLNGLDVAAYTEGGMAFDDSGQLWAITDRATQLQPSQVMKLNTTTGTASDVLDTDLEGLESLAITPPRGCAPSGNGDYAAFVVQTRFVDKNDVTPITLNIQCNDGYWGESSRTILPEAGFSGRYEVRFVVENFVDGVLNCEIWEDSPPGYTPEYDCQVGAACSSNAGAGPCTFEGIGINQEELCLIQNNVSPVDVTVTKEWLYPREELVVDDSAVIELNCANVFGGDGEWVNSGQMRWSWLFDGNPASQVAAVQPDYEGTTLCWTTETYETSAVETESSCASPVAIALGDTGRTCLVSNTVFFEGIPSLSEYGLLLFSALMLLTGLFAVRRTG